ncbi:MAG: chorismate synthase [Mariprofundales bacterium]
MGGSIFGASFRVSTAGESHGKGLVAIVDGCPAGIPLTLDDLQPELDRRKPGQSRHTTQRREDDIVEILSGVFEGITTGTPIALLICNTDQRSKDYGDIKDKFRPGHADFTYHAKYGRRDYRGGGRASARETAMRVAAGGIARKLLAIKGVKITGWLAQLGSIIAQQSNFDVDEIKRNDFFCPDAEAAGNMAVFMDKLRKQGDSVGAAVIICADGVPAGLGEPVFDRLDAEIGKAMLSIPAVKGIEIGDGFDCINAQGSYFGDSMIINNDSERGNNFASNHAGGILGGISNGNRIVVRIALKPTSSIRIARPTLDIHGNATSIATKGRHDPCVGIRAVPIAEAMLALVLADHLLRQRSANIA